MDKNLDEHPGIREYHLGIPENPDIMRQIEEKLMADDKFAEELSVAEDALIEQYLDDELSDTEREHFIRHFLAAPERKEKLRLVQNLRRYAAAQEQAEAGAEALPERTTVPGWRRFLSMPALSYALVLVVALFLGYGVWRINTKYPPDVDTALAELRLAYKGARPLNSRIAGFDYAPSPATRGPADKKLDSLELRRATGMLEEAVADKRTAQSLYGRGKAYLAEGKFQDAINAFEEAARMGPVTAVLMSDLGAAQMEAAESPGAAKGAMLDAALRSLDKAIELDPKLLEPRFNRALCLEAMESTESAKTAWREYLELDPNTQWSGEARRHLERLEDK